MESSPNESKEKIKPWEKRREKNPNKEMNSEDLPAITNDFLFHHLLPSLLLLDVSLCLHSLFLNSLYLLGFLSEREERYVQRLAVETTSLSIPSTTSLISCISLMLTIICREINESRSDSWTSSSFSSFDSWFTNDESRLDSSRVSLLLLVYFISLDER